MNPLIHYLKFGVKEGRRITTTDNSANMSRDIEQSTPVSEDFVEIDLALRSFDFDHAQLLLDGLEEPVRGTTQYWDYAFRVARMREDKERMDDTLSRVCELPEASVAQIENLIEAEKRNGRLFGDIDQLYGRLLGMATPKSDALYKYMSHVWEREPLTEAWMTRFETLIGNLPESEKRLPTGKPTAETRLYGRLLLLQGNMYASFGAMHQAHRNYLQATKRGAPTINHTYLTYKLLRNGRKAKLNHRFVEQLDAYERSPVKLRNLILESGGSLCIVGNSPNVANQRRGEAIDSQELVIRFNNYSTDYPYSEDIGVKTDVWVRMPFHPYVKRGPQPGLRLTVFAGSNRLARPSVALGDILDYRAAGHEIDFFEPAVFYELQERLGCPPTSGLYVCYLAHKLLGPLSEEHVAGFSYTDGSGESTKYHLNDSSAAMGNRHAWDVEGEVFRSLLRSETTVPAPTRVQLHAQRVIGNGNQRVRRDFDASLYDRHYDLVISTSPGLQEYELFGCRPTYISAKSIDSHFENRSPSGDGARSEPLIEELINGNGKSVCIVGFGRSRTGIAAKRLADVLDCESYLAEYGLISSMVLPGEPRFAFSLMLDDRGIFYDTTTESLIEHILLNSSEIFECDVQRRARSLIRKIVQNNVTKYNNAPDALLPTAGRRRILVVDQTANDNSILFGQCEQYGFGDMVDFAMSQDAEVVVKLHPETAAGKKGGNLESLEKYRDSNKLRVVGEQCNIVSLIKQVDEVYVMTSGVGLEAVMVGKPVRCFGVPFYSGWSLTTDMVRSDNPRRPLTAESLAAAVFLLATRWYHPESKAPCDADTCIDWVVENRVQSEAVQL